MRSIIILLIIFYSLILLISCENEAAEPEEIYCRGLPIIELWNPQDLLQIETTKQEISEGTFTVFRWESTGEAFETIYLFDEQIEVDRDTCEILNYTDAIWQWNNYTESPSTSEGGIQYKDGFLMQDGSLYPDEELINLSELQWEKNPQTGILDLYWIVLSRNTHGDLEQFSRVREFSIKEVAEVIE